MEVQTRGQGRGTVGVRAAYEGVTRWVRFNAWMTLRELRQCNEGWISPRVGLYLESPRPPASLSDRLLGLIEEAASAVWLMYGEHEALLERLRELFGPSGEMALPDDVSSVFASATEPEATLSVVRRSLGARAALLADHACDVDAHTRLVFRKHLTIVNGLIRPALDAVAEGGGLEALDRAGSAGGSRGVAGPLVEQRDLEARYRQFLPDGPRPHPDSFLSLALLSRGGERDRVDSDS